VNDNDTAVEQAPWRIVLVDDHPIVRDGLKQMIERDPALQVCGEAGSADEALVVVAAQHPDLIIVDVFLEGINGIELTKMLCDRDPKACVLVLSMHDETLYAERAVRAGAKGYVMKQEASRTILDAIHTVMRGELFVSAAIRASLEDIGSAERLVDVSTILNRLSTRELGVFEAIGKGLDRNQIADKLGISIKTVETHRANIKYKLNVGSATALAGNAKAWVRKKESKADG
jgi:DNA-binding NarL/FixJ family response regulator